jgi:hypothetical protein
VTKAPVAPAPPARVAACSGGPTGRVGALTLPRCPALGPPRNASRERNGRTNIGYWLARELEGRFALGVGSGEALNEHILGTVWPDSDTRLEMLEEAVEVIRTLWRGGVRDHRGTHDTVQNARIYDLPGEPPPIYVSGFGPKSVRLAARIGDGYVTTKPDGELITEEMVAEAVPCGPDLDRHVAALQEYADAGVDELFVQQIGPDQDAFFGEWARAVLPHFAKQPAVRSA